MKFNAFIISTLLLIGCNILSNTLKVDKEYLEKNATDSHNQSRIQCYEAAKKVIRDMGGDIEKEKKKEFQFMSNIFNANTMVVGGSVSANVIKDDHKFYIGVTGDKNSCVVKVFKYKVWLNNKELVYINPMFFKRQMSIFFNNLRLQLKDDKF